MNQVIVNKTSRHWEAIPLDTFIKEYGITPKHTGENFYAVRQQDRDWFIYSFPNPACIFLDGRIQYIIYKGNVQTIINGVVMPPCDFLGEDQVFSSEDDALAVIHRIEESHYGEMWIDLPSGERISLGKNTVS